ncbi:TonB-dependent siderophore receptor [Silvibacterium dinghuense]|uniref:TonB-dependent siderophore receptor n=1 Tax=Silvibacterium dinghuense TaxID=1560006 RepID=A0A4Q1SHH2_9BACT|nr:TonB-dependent siderophore receptor [Silvibacterium dinghuense]RXS96815.1 TonB-dependent siderophore receptor [Silvibacterium dinghuense]
MSAAHGDSSVDAVREAQPLSASRGKRGSLMMVAALALAGFAAHGADAAAAASDPKDGGIEKAPVPDADGQAAQGETVHHFKIAAGPLSEVLASMEKETGISFSLASDSIGELPSPGVTGVLTVKEALTQILANTGVSARAKEQGRVELFLSGSNSSVEVNDQALSSMKYTAPLLDLPQTITVIGEETLQNTASTTLVEALRTIPGITFGAGEGGNPIGDRPFIRGMDSQASTYIDGMQDIAAQSREVFDVESIEVSEGPGGAYGGRGTAGGSINMNSKLPRRDNFIAGSFTPGTSDYERGTVDGNLKINSLMTGRLAGVWHNADVPGRDGAHNNRWGVAPSLAIGLGGPTRAYLDYYHLITNDIPDSGIPYNNPTTVPTVDPGSRILEKGDGEPVKLPHRNFYYGLIDRDHDRAKNKTATARVERDLWHASSLLRNSFRYEATNEDYIWTLPDDSQGNIYYGYVFRRPNDRVSSTFTAMDQVDLSGQFKTASIKHSYAAGAEFSQERGNNDAYTINSKAFSNNTETCPNGVGVAGGYNCTYLYAPNMRDPWWDTGTITLNHNPTKSKSVEKSVYAFDTVILNSHFQSTLGIRYDNYDSQYQSAVTSGVRSKYFVDNNLVNYLASVVYKPDSATSFYGTVSTAAIPTGNALSQGVDTSALTSQINADLEPEKIREEEIGVKREIAHGKAMVHADLFRMDIQNVRITQADGTIAAAGTDRTLGGELTVSGDITRKWQLTGGYTYLDAVLEQAGGSGTASGLANGNSMPNTPRHSVAITSNYKVLPRLRLGGGIYGMTMVWGSQLNNKWVPGYVREDIFGSYEFNKHLNLQLNVQNAGDKLYYDEAYATHYAQMAPGRSGTLGFNVKF